MTINYFQHILIFILFIIEKFKSDPVYNIKDFRSNPLGIAEREDLFRVKLGVPNESRIMAYISDDEASTLKFYKYEYDAGIFVEDIDIKFKTFNKDIFIKNLIGNDLNNDGMLDLILTIYDIITQKTSTEVYLYDSANNNYNLVFSKDNTGVFFGDFDGDRLVDLIFYDEIKKERRFVHFENNSYIEKPFSQLFNSNNKLCDNNIFYNYIPIPVDHSSGFVDIDADCQNDLIISSRIGKWDSLTNTTIYSNYLEIWRGSLENGEVKYCLNKNSVYKLDNSLGAFTISDINRDGLLDFVFPVLNSAKVFINYNTIKLSYDWSADFCSTHSNTNMTQINKIFDEFDSSQLNSNFTNSSLISLSNNPDEVFYGDELFSTLIRIGDINSDSYPDLLTVTIDKINNSHFTKVFLNLQEDSKRTFNSNQTYLIPVNNTVQASFFDLDENGQLDILVIAKNDQNYRDSRHNGNLIYSTIGFYNNYIYDVFFLKSVTLLKKDIFYSNELGANYRFISTNLDGSRRMDVSFQGIQIGNAYLNLPYAFIGIGRSNNYIENFHVISNIFAVEEENYKIFTPIIPNSQLIISKTLDDSQSPAIT